MGLHNISADSTTLEYHCNNPTCAYHNCANWESFLTCKAHDQYEYVTIPADEMRKRMAGMLTLEQIAKVTDTIMMQPSTLGRRVGQAHQLSITDPGIVWTGPHIVALPTCECGTRMFLKVVFTPQELQAPNIQRAIRDPQNPTHILRIEEHPMVARHIQLAQKLTSLGNVWKPTP